MTSQPRRGLPILGQLSPLSAAFLVGTVVLSLAAIVLDFGLHVDETVLFVVSAAAILGLAWVVGLSTERLGSITGPQVGGILNATFGNIAELIIAFFALQAGLIEVVKASLTGSIIGNLLLVMGLSALVGGLKHGAQHFSPKIAVSNAALLVLALIGLFVPAIFAFTTHDQTPGFDHRGIGPRRGRPDRRLRPVAHLPVQPPRRHVECRRRGRRAWRAGLERSHGHRRPARGGRAAGGPVGDPGQLDRAVHRQRSGCRSSSSASSSSRPSATSPSTSCRSSWRPRTRWNSRWR